MFRGHALRKCSVGRFRFLRSMGCRLTFDGCRIASLGVCAEWAVFNNVMPGWWCGAESYGYQGNEGKLFACSNPSPSIDDHFDGIFGPKYGPGDIIGCGVDFANRTLFFTKNGEFLGELWSGGLSGRLQAS